MADAAKHVKSGLTKTEKSFYRDLLLKARASFASQVKFHADEALESKKDAAGERAGMATHMADLGSDSSRQELELGLMSEEVNVIEMIEDALQRLDDDEYGICLECGGPIPEARLKAKPYARYCTKCKSQMEAADGFSRRTR